ncbi:MAG TPA: hypothetical protein VMM93_09175, partial [Vicinamibacterales bacterium]|nr:hypothetical protein [Vicinamibacterales bacterium]
MKNQTRLRFGLLLLGGMALAAYPYVTGVAASAPGGAQAAAGDRLQNEPAHPALQGFGWRSIGPTGQGGRIHAIEAVESDTKTFFLGFATAGLWKTSNRGVTYDLVFPVQDDHHTHSIGALAIAPSNPNILYVGTGEACNRQSSSFGTGVYKSTDGGTTFTHLGLRETQSIARIVVHPRNPDMAWVAAVGNLFGSNAERGLFMTTDGGKIWNKTLYLDEHTGVTDVVVDRSNPNILLAATYQRQRSAWGFIGGGPGSGIHQSSDGGRTWRRLSGNGLPAGVMGRIGLAMSRSNPNVVYAQIEVAPTEAVAGAAPPAPLAGRGGGGGGGGGRGGQ